MNKSLREIEEEFLGCESKEMRTQLYLNYEADERKGVQKLLERFRKADKKLEDERLRVENMCVYEKKHGRYEIICGIDEAGRGPLAGPVVAGAAVLPKDCRILYINDSKKLSAKKRDELYDEIRERAVSFGVGVIDHERIDEINILQATYEAMRAAISSLSVSPDMLLNDAVRIPGIDIPQEAIIKGDAKSQSIAAASILAKVTRDRIMEAYALIYPEYGFEKNKGYGSAEHIAAIKKYGPCPIHRKSFIKNFI